MSDSQETVILKGEVRKCHQQVACDYCSSDEHMALVRERGLIEADYKIENTYGETLAVTCETCLDTIRNSPLNNEQ